MNMFGWSYPPGAADDPNAPYNQVEPPCEMCGKWEGDCPCPECPGCSVVGDPKCYGKEGHLPLPEGGMPIRNLAGLCEMIGTSHDTIASVSKAIYKGTDCGAWVDTDGEEVMIGSIVEGVDHCTEIQHLAFPFTKKAFWEAVEVVEAEAKQIWTDTHGCEQCEADGYVDENGQPGQVNPDCPQCQGQGVVI